MRSAKNSQTSEPISGQGGVSLTDVPPRSIFEDGSIQVHEGQKVFNPPLAVLSIYGVFVGAGPERKRGALAFHLESPVSRWKANAPLFHVCSAYADDVWLDVG